MSSKIVALTFDDGPSNITSDVLDILEENKIRASFFLIGENIMANQEVSASIMQRQIEMGCELCNHSLTHSDMTTLDFATIQDEINQTSAAIENIVGVTPKFFRPPFISVNDTMYEAVDLPFVCGVDSKDWDGNTTPEDRIKNAMDGVRDGAVILMHDFTDNTNTLMALPELITRLKNEGYEFVTMGELFEKSGVDSNRHGHIWTYVKE